MEKVKSFTVIHHQSINLGYIQPNYHNFRDAIFPSHPFFHLSGDTEKTPQKFSRLRGAERQGIAAAQARLEPFRRSIAWAAKRVVGGMSTYEVHMYMYMHI